jgi:exosome complex component RRP42
MITLTPGRLEFFIDCSANATPEFEGRGGEALATEVSRTLTHAYNDNNVFDLTALAILAGKHCWILYVDILVCQNHKKFFLLSLLHIYTG